MVIAPNEKILNHLGCVTMYYYMYMCMYMYMYMYMYMHINYMFTTSHYNNGISLIKSPIFGMFSNYTPIINNYTCTCVQSIKCHCTVTEITSV